VWIIDEGDRALKRWQLGGNESDECEREFSTKMGIFGNFFIFELKTNFLNDNEISINLIRLKENYISYRF